MAGLGKHKLFFKPLEEQHNRQIAGAAVPSFAGLARLQARRALDEDLP